MSPPDLRDKLAIPKLKFAPRKAFFIQLCENFRKFIRYNLSVFNFVISKAKSVFRRLTIKNNTRLSIWNKIRGSWNFFIILEQIEKTKLLRENFLNLIRDIFFKMHISIFFMFGIIHISLAKTTVLWPILSSLWGGCWIFHNFEAPRIYFLSLRLRQKWLNINYEQSPLWTWYIWHRHLLEDQRDHIFNNSEV